MNSDRKPFCYKLCPTGHAYYEKIIMSCESAFDAVFDFDCFCKECWNKCPHKTLRDWENPDGIEWWKLNNIEAHSYGHEKKELIGDIMDIERYKDYVSSGMFTPYDGCGYYCTNDTVLDEHSDFSIEAINKKISLGYEYVIWYNK